MFERYNSLKSYKQDIVRKARKNLVPSKVSIETARPGLLQTFLGRTTAIRIDVLYIDITPQGRKRNAISTS